MSEQEQVVNWDVALEGVGGEKDLLKDISAAFLDEAPQLLAAMRTSSEKQDKPTLHRAAHTLRGSLRFFGNEPAAAAAQIMEAIGKEGDFQKAAGFLPELEQLVEQLLKCLREYVAKSGD